MLRTTLTLLAVAAGVTAVVAQTDPLAVRKALMKENDDHYRALRAMTRGEQPFDAAKVDAAFQQWGDTAVQLPKLFPTPPKPGEETRAALKIWETKADFDARTAAFGKAVADNRDKAKTLDGLKAVFAAIENSCNDCHGDYRARRQR
jgi:cytochrome c556